jgi:hypothetical protein
MGHVKKVNQVCPFFRTLYFTAEYNSYIPGNNIFFSSILATINIMQFRNFNRNLLNMIKNCLKVMSFEFI